MIGYSFVHDEWYVCKFERTNLYILKTKCEKPRIINGDINAPANIIVAIFEDGRIYYFDKTSTIEIIPCSEYYEYLYCDINYFVLDGQVTNLSFGKIGKVSFVGGVISPMLQLMDSMEFSLLYQSKQLKVLFNKSAVNNEDSCDTDCGKLILESKNYSTKYSIDIEFDETDNFDFIYAVINKMYDFIKFINYDYQPSIQKIEVQDAARVLSYHDRTINYDCAIVSSFSYLGNIKSKIENVLKYVLENECEKFDFLSLLEKKEILFAETNVLAEAIESIVDDRDCNFSGELKQEIDLYVKLKAEIKKTIDNFEKENSTIDNNKKSFILSLVEMSRFRQKVECLFLEYNKFAQNYPSFYSNISESDIKAISKDIQTERNNIHGNNCHVDSDKYFIEVQYVLFGLLIYISKKCQLDDSEIFNLYNKLFKYRFPIQ